MSARFLPIVLVLLLAACGRPGASTAQGQDPTPPRRAFAPVPLPNAATPQAAPGTASNVAAVVAAPPATPPGTEAPPPPLDLTTSDGSGLQLRVVRARAVIQGPLAFTELQLTFRNPEPRQREGRFAITLPPGAAVSRFAMRQPTGWMEGEVVEKQRARVIYEDFLHRRQDPALLEQDAGNVFSARVFPIRPSDDVDLIVSWSQERTDPAVAFSLPLKGLPRLEELSVRVFVDDGAAEADEAGTLGATTAQVQVVKVEQRDVQPGADLEVWPDRLRSEHDGLRAGRVAVARVTPQGKTQAAGFEHLVLLVDTSASMTLARSTLAERVRQVVAKAQELGAQRATILAFDQEVTVLHDGDPAGIDQALDALGRRRLLGASDLGRALQAVGERVHGQAGRKRVVLIGDGMATAGERDPAQLREKAAALAAVGVERLDVVTVTTARDVDLLQALATAGKVGGVVVDARRSVDLQDLGRATFGPIDVQVPGAAWVWPDRLQGAVAGQPVLVYADLPPDQPFSVRLSGGLEQTVTPAVRQAAGPLVHRAQIAARIRLLYHKATQGDPDLREALRLQAVKLSVEHRVLGPDTALLVLESEADYARYGLDRKALADVLTVGPEGVVVTAPRVLPAIARPQTEPRPSWPNEDRQREGKQDKAADLAGQPRDEAGNGAPEPEAKALEEAQDAAAPSRLFGGGGEDEAPKAEAKAPTAPPPPREERSLPLRLSRSDDDRRPDPPSGGTGFRGTGQGGGGSGYGRIHGLGRGPGARAGGEIARRRAYLSDEPSQDPLAREELDRNLREHPALTGKLAEVEALLRQKDPQKALQIAQQWQAEQPLDVLALVALGDALRDAGQPDEAARAYGSIIDLYPARADLRRFAGNLLESLGSLGLALAIDSYRAAREQRPDHPAVYLMLGLALAQAGQHAEAIEALEAGLTARHRDGNFPEIERILGESLQLVAAAWLQVEPKRAAEIAARLAGRGLHAAAGPELRLHVTWETDANDVDVHVVDGRGGHASFRSRDLPSGGRLYADVTTGYGPECVAIPRPAAFPYRLYANYYRMGPMGYGMGRLQVVRHDGAGRLRIESRPFVIQADGAWVDLGQVTEKGSLGVAVPVGRKPLQGGPVPTAEPQLLQE